MSMQPQASPRTISSIISRKRVSVIRPVSGSMVVVPSRMEKISAAMAIPPWKPWWAITETSARPIISETSE